MLPVREAHNVIAPLFFCFFFSFGWSGVSSPSTSYPPLSILLSSSVLLFSSLLIHVMRIYEFICTYVRYTYLFYIVRIEYYHYTITTIFKDIILYCLHFFSIERNVARPLLLLPLYYRSLLFAYVTFFHSLSCRYCLYSL